MNIKISPGEKHFTASVCIVTKEEPKRMVLVHHRKFNKWQQPGGHVEPFENPVETAVRETKEETGIDISFILNNIEAIDPMTGSLPLPRFFLEETIPAIGEEPGHYHLDHIYLVEVPYQIIKHQESEAHGIGWFTIEEAMKLPMHENGRIIFNKLLT